MKNNKNEKEKEIKISFVGEGAVGKSNTMNVYYGQKFSEKDWITTIPNIANLMSPIKIPIILIILVNIS